MPAALAGILFWIVLVLFIVGLYIIWKKSKINKALKVTLTIVGFIVFSCVVNVTLLSGVKKSGRMNNRGDSNTASQEIWNISTENKKDDFGDITGSEDLLSATFSSDDESQDITIVIRNTEELGPLMQFAVSQRIEGRHKIVGSNSFFGATEMKTRISDEDDKSYILMPTDSNGNLCLFDYYKYRLDQLDSISEGLVGGKNNISEIMNQMNDLSEGQVDKEKEQYNVKNLISKIYEGGKPIRCAIIRSDKNCNFTIEPSNFKKAFDKIWSYDQMMVE